MKGGSLNQSEARQSPCKTCGSAPCCRLLQLESIEVRTIMDLDRISYYLNFDNLVVAVSAEGAWTVYYRYPCRHLDDDTSACRVHGKPEQPGICVHYNPYQCFYKRAERARHTPDESMVWVSQGRLAALLAQLSYDTDRNIVELPASGTLYSLLCASPYFDPPLVEVGEDRVMQAWKATALAPGTGQEIPVQRTQKRFAELQDACAGCAAHCCKNLLFPRSLPTTFADLDFYRYCLGFPGIQLGISDSQWTLIVRSRCRKLDGNNRCSLYGRPERPLLCRYYDASHCSYKHRLGEERPAGYLRIGYPEYVMLLDTYRFDDAGVITHGWDVETLRRQVETNWRKEAARVLA